MLLYLYDIVRLFYYGEEDMKYKPSNLILIAACIISIITFLMIVMKVNVPYIVYVLIGGLLFAASFLGSREDRRNGNIYWIITAYYLFGVPIIGNIVLNKSIFIGIIIVSFIVTTSYIFYDVLYGRQRRP